jgi:hypothetical protein
MTQPATCTYGPCRLPASEELGELSVWEGRNAGNELWHSRCRAEKEANIAQITAQLASMNLRSARRGSKRYDQAM